MRYIIYGAGAIGGVIGAKLHQQGYPVSLIARGPHLQAIQARGLVLETPEESVTLDIPAFEHPSDIEFESDDVVLLAMKSQHTNEALIELRDAAGDAIAVVCCQNGVSNEKEAARIFERVYGMVVVTPAAHTEPGVVQATTTGILGMLDCGSYPDGVDATITELATALKSANFVARGDSAIMRMKYAKLLMNLGNALQAACGQPEGEREMMRLLRDEALSCFKAAGIDCAGREEFQSRFKGLMNEAPIRGEYRGGGSTWQSLYRGTGSSEVDYLNGEIVMLGRICKVSTPANRALQQIVNEMTSDGAPPGSVAIEAVYERIAALE
jgi:2-dehydropantoate 2-reductase